MFSTIWSAVVPFCIFLNYFIWRHMVPPESLRMFILFALGALIAAPIALWLTRIIAEKSHSSVFSAHFFTLGIGTIGLTALLFAFDFWLYFSQWHGQFLSKLWAVQFFFTFASAVYQFLVSGLRLYLPCGFIALFVASLWASRRIIR